MTSSNDKKFSQLLSHHNALRLELAQALKELDQFRAQSFALSKENAQLKGALATDPERGDPLHLQLENQHLHKKLAEVNALVQQKDQTIQEIFSSPTFKVGKAIASAAKKVPGGDKLSKLS